MSSLQVTIYTTTTCPYCGMLKEYLQEKGIVFSEKLVDQDESARKEMALKSQGYLGVPFVVVKKDSGEEDSIIGFDKLRLSQVLGIE